MKSYSIIATAALVTVAFGGPFQLRGTAQQPAVATGTPTVPGVQATYVLAEFTNSLNGKKLKPGALIRAEVAQDVLAHGKIIIPADARVLGHVTEVKPRGRDAASRLGIIFDKILLKHHEERNLQGVVYALAPPTERRSKVDEPDQMLPPSFGMGGGGTTPMGSRSSIATRSTPAPMMSGNSTSAPVTSAAPNSPGSRQGESAATSSRLAPSMSLGIPSGVYRMKGVSLSQVASPETPGPVILSTANDVQLDYGTQVIIKVMDVRALQP